MLTDAVRPGASCYPRAVQLDLARGEGEEEANLPRVETPRRERAPVHPSRQMAAISRRFSLTRRDATRSGSFAVGKVGAFARFPRCEGALYPSFSDNAYRGKRNRLLYFRVRDAFIVKKPQRYTKCIVEPRNEFSEKCFRKALLIDETHNVFGDIAALSFEHRDGISSFPEWYIRDLLEISRQIG